MQRPSRVLTDEEILRIQEVAPSIDPKASFVIDFAAETGCRAVEFHRLNVECFYVPDVQQGLETIRCKVWGKARDDYNDVVFISRALYNRAMKLADGGFCVMQGYKNNCISPRRIQQLMSRVAVASGVSFTLHDLRASAAAQVYSATQSFDAAQDFLRHRHGKSTMHYIREVLNKKDRYQLEKQRNEVERSLKSLRPPSRLLRARAYLRGLWSRLFGPQAR